MEWNGFAGRTCLDRRRLGCEGANRADVFTVGVTPVEPVEFSGGAVDFLRELQVAVSLPI